MCEREKKKNTIRSIGLFDEGWRKSGKGWNHSFFFPVDGERKKKQHVSKVGGVSVCVDHLEEVERLGSRCVCV